jgi:hypothetical protein
MGQVCENCGWREHPSNNTGKGCIFSNPKKKKIWNSKGYNQPCNNYVMSITLREHLKELLGVKE